MSSTSEWSYEEMLQCSICLEVFSEPVTTSCGHNFCRRCISQAWDTDGSCRCPLCRKMFHSRPQLKVNTNLKKVVSVYRKHNLKRAQQSAVEVTLDPDTAHPDLVLSEDLKQVHDTNVRKKLPDSPLRFDRCVIVLGKQSFSSGRFYFEVQVKGKTEWDLGVAQESINRKGKITLWPKYGAWCITLRNKDKYYACADPLTRLFPQTAPQKVGVFVDYGKGLVSFYDADSADLLYSFTDCCFREKMFPFFSPSLNYGGSNSAPLVLTAVETLSGDKVQKYCTEV